MNEVFLIGKVISEINFNFMIESKNDSMSIFCIETINKQIINIKAYDGLADFSYRNLKSGKIVFIYGELKQEYVKAKEIVIFK